MYKNSYNCDIFLGIGGNDKKAHKYRTSNDTYQEISIYKKEIPMGKPMSAYEG